MAGVVKDEGTSFGLKFYPKSQDLHSAQDFKELVETIESTISLPFPNLNSEKITEYFLKNVDTNNSEALKKAFNTFYGELRITCSAYFFAKKFAEYSPTKNVFFYHWTYVSTLIQKSLGCSPDMGVCHTSEVPYVFGLPVLKNMNDKKFSEYAVELWTNFAKHGLLSQLI